MAVGEDDAIDMNLILGLFCVVSYQLATLKAHEKAVKANSLRNLGREYTVSWMNFICRDQLPISWTECPEVQRK